MKLIFHIGAHKTGTTAIQSVAVHEHAELVKRGIWYPIGLYPELPEQHSKIYWELSEACLPALRSRMESAVAAAKSQNCSTLFMSGEDMGSAGMDRAKLFIQACGDLFSSTHFVLVLREKRHYFGSHYNHTLSFGQQVFFSDFPEYIQFSPSKTVDVWRYLCGPDAIRIFSYSGEGALVTRFYRELLGYEVVNPDRYRGINSSIDFLSALLMNVLLKEEGNFDPERFIRIYSEIFRGAKVSFPINERVAAQISGMYPKADWIVDGVDWDKPAVASQQPSLADSEIVDYLQRLSQVLSKYAEDLSSRKSS